jgi:hypothetical protein
MTSMIMCQNSKPSSRKKLGEFPEILFTPSESMHQLHGRDWLSFW